jgi:hypothetical protein
MHYDHRNEGYAFPQAAQLDNSAFLPLDAMYA